MAGELTDDAERAVVDAITGVAPLSWVHPLIVRLMSVAGDDATAGTEIAGDEYEPQPVIFGASTTVAGVTSALNSAAVTFNSLDSTLDIDVNGAEVWDSAAVPSRIASKSFATITVVAGDPLTIPVGEIEIGQS